MNKKILCLILALFMVLGLFCFPVFASQDESALDRAGRLGLIPDCLEGADLGLPVTRAEFAAVAVKTYEYFTGSKIAPVPVNPFADTRDSEVLKAHSVGIVSGTSPGKFSPDAVLSREQAAVMLTRVLKAARISGWTLATDGNYKLDFIQPPRFADDDRIGGWAKPSVYFMVANNIIFGAGNNTFSTRATTREQSLIIAARMADSLFYWDGAVSAVYNAPTVAHGLTYHSASANFEYYTTKPVDAYIDHITNVLESTYVQMRREFGVTLSDITAVRIYPDFRSFFIAVGRDTSTEVSDYHVYGHFRAGYSDGTNGIYMSPPNSEIMKDQDRYYDKILIHEFVHVLAEEINTAYTLQQGNLHWLAEGLADYKSGQLAGKYSIDILKSAVRSRTVPSLADLEITDTKKFSDMNGYVYGASIIEFIDKRYGFAKVLEFYRSPGEYDEVFYLSKKEFEGQWKQFLYDNYR